MNLITHKPPAFEHDPNRDASKTIRGFVYQADLTIQEWISLSPGEILLLEQGEDIDRVAAAVLAGEPHRIVEQVKSLERRVTLRSKATLEAVANFALHRDRNPGVRLRFRFITNAMIGKEQKVTFPGARKGIAAWSRLHEANLSKDQRSALATALRDFYRGLRQPKRFPKDAWTALHTLLQSASEDEWLDFLTGFEWTTGNVAPDMLPAQIRSDLVARGISADGVQAKEHHNRLFLHVIRLLSIPGEKRLETSQIASVVAAPADTVLAGRVDAVVAWSLQFEQRLHDVEVQVASLQRHAASQTEVTDAAIEAHVAWSRASYGRFYSVALGRHLCSSSAWDRVRLPSAEENRRGEEAAAKVLARHSRLLLIAGAGAGKSTLCLSLGAAVAERGELALRVSLGETMRRLISGMTFTQALADLVPSLEAAPARGEVIAGRLRLLLADGLDECGTNRALVAQKLLEWSRAHDHCRIVVTTRAFGGMQELLPDFEVAELLHLDRDAARSLASSLLNEAQAPDPNSAWESLEKVLPRRSLRAGSPVGEAARNPLLLSFLVALAAQGVALDGTRAEVYGRIVAAIRERGRPDRVPDAEPSEPVLRFVFDALGWHLLQDPAADLRTLRERIAPEMAAAAELPFLAAEIAFDDAVGFWRDRGVLDRIGEGGFEAIVFVHQSLAEYGAGRRVAAFSSAQLRTWVENAVTDAGSAREVMLFAAGAGAANAIAAIALDEQANPWSMRPLLAANVLAETRTPDKALLATVVARLAERVGSSAPIVAVEAGLALERLVASAGRIIVAAVRPLLDSEHEWTRLAAIAPMLAADSGSVPVEAAHKWLRELRLVERISFGDRWTRERDLPYAAADLQETALPRAVQLVAERAPKDEARETFDQLLSRSVGDFDTHAQVSAILRNNGFEDVEERHRVDMSSTWRTTLEMVERERPLELEFLDEVAAALNLHNDDGLPPDEGLPNLTALVRALHVDWFTRIMAKRQRDILRGIIRAIASATVVDADRLANEIRAVRQRIASGDHIFRCIGELDQEPDWARGAQVVDSSVLFRALKHSSDGVNIAAAYLLADKGLTEDELVEGFRGAMVEGYATTLSLVGQLALQLLPPDRAASLLVERLGHAPTRGCSHLYEALGKLASTTSPEYQKQIRSTIAAGLIVENPDAAAAAADVASLFVPDDEEVSHAVLLAFEYWSVDRGTCGYCKTPLIGDSCRKCHRGVRHPRPLLLRLKNRIASIPGLSLLDLANDRISGVSEVARELLTARISDDDAALAEIIAKLGDDAAPIRLATRLRAIRMVFAVPAERIRAHVHELGELFESAVPQVRAAFLDGIRGDSLDPEIAQFVDRALADAAPSVRSAAAGLARRMHDAGWR